MRREDFTIDVDCEETPQLQVTFEGNPETLQERLGGEDGLAADEIDVAYRQTGTDDPGVLSVTDRLTGEFVFEAPCPSDGLQRLVETVNDRAEEDRQYTLRIDPGDGDDVTFQKEMLLVYDATGGLDREHSLIPGGVEL